MPRVSVHATDHDSADDDGATATDSGPEFADGVDDVFEDAEEDARKAKDRQRRKRRSDADSADVEIEKEVTKRAIIDSVTRLLVVILYMAFTLIREREAGVVALDPEDDDLGPEDDWAE